MSFKTRTDRPAIARARGFSALLLGLVSVGTACVDDLGQGPADEPVALSLSASIVGLQQAVTYTVQVEVNYHLAGGSSGPLDITPSSFTITSDVPASPRRIAVDLTRCLEDASRIDADSDACQLSVTLRLTDETGELAQATENLGLVREGDELERPAPISITPSYSLVIEGGGLGTGSGIVLVAAAGSQSPLTCSITEGLAAAEGCSARYPLHTAVTLTPSGGTLSAWDGDCSATPGGPCQLTMDGHRRVVAGFAPIPTTGELAVEIAGLPVGTPAQVIVSNEAGFTQLLTSSTVLSGLLPGDYDIVASPVTVTGEGRTYSPSPQEQVATVIVGQRAVVQIGYNPPETGSLAVAISGLPEGTAASVGVSGPSGFSRTLTTGETLSGLLPGSYTITAQDVESSDQVYAPTPATQNRTVAANQTAQASVAYAASRATLTVIVSGLPAGVNALVTVSGPGGFRQDLTGTTEPPLVKLPPGNYTVAASPVTTGGQAYNPVVTPPRPVLIRPGSSATVTVSYGVASATSLVFLQQPTTTAFDSIIRPAITVEARDAEGRPVPSYTGAVSLALEAADEDSRPATLGGTTTVVPVNGVATFEDLTVDRAGDYRLQASSGALDPATSDRFKVTTGTPVIISVDFPSTVSNGPGTSVPATVGFADAGRDITRLVVTEISDPNEIYSPRTFAIKPPSEGPDVVVIPLWQCASRSGCPTGPVTVDLTMEDIDGNVSAPSRVSFTVAGSAPVIDLISLGPVSGEPGSRTTGTIHFRDPDGDVVLVTAEVIECEGITCTWRDFDPNVGGQRTEGRARFTVGCTGPGSCAGGRVTLRMALVDFAGNRSNSVDLSFTYTFPPIGVHQDAGARGRAVGGLSLEGSGDDDQ